MKLPDWVTLREVAPRDGFQALAQFIATRQKLEIIELLLKAGVRELEVTSFASPKAIPQLADAAELLAMLPSRPAISRAAMAPNLKGARNAVAAGADQLVLVISASNAHNRANVRRTIAESLVEAGQIFRLAAAHEIPLVGAIAVAFGCPYQGEVAQDDVIRIASAYVEGGTASVILADTTGMATPPRISGLVRHFQDRFPQTRLILHLHNNRGTAMVNLFAALLDGVTCFDTALGGIGGCPNVPRAAGNLPTEDVVYLLEEMGITTGLELEAVITAARRLESIVGTTLPGQVMKSGPRDPARAAGLCRSP